MLHSQSQMSRLVDRRVLLLDSDAPHRARIGEGLASRGFEPILVDSMTSAMASVRDAPPAFAVIDTHLSEGSGVEVVEALRTARPDSKIIVLTAYGSITSAVAAAKAGAVDYLCKPADADDVSKALLAAARNETPAPPDNPMRVDDVRWAHIQCIYEQCGQNISQTARRLQLHRRTLQRILTKHAPRSRPQAWPTRGVERYCDGGGVFA